jgi:hypothetical protein
VSAAGDGSFGQSGDERPPETGWLADTPIDDNVIRGFLHNQADYGDLLAEGFGGITARTPDVALAASRCVVPYFNEALLLRPILDARDPVLDEIDEFFAGSEASGWILLSAWPTPSLRERGWGLVGHPAFVLRTPGVPLRPPADRPGVALEVRRATSTEDVLAAERVMAEGYPMEEAQGRPGSAFPETLAETDLSVRIASIAGADGHRDDVAVGMGYVAHGVVNLCGAATLPAARRTGAWGALVRARVDDAPHLPAVAFTSDFSRPGFEHLGFVSVFRCTMWARGRA